MKVGAATTEVSVSGAASTVDTTTPTINDTLSVQLVETLPVQSSGLYRDTRLAAELTGPGAVPTVNSNGPVQGVFLGGPPSLNSYSNFNGVRAGNNVYRIDSTDVTDQNYGMQDLFQRPRISRNSRFKR